MKHPKDVLGRDLIGQETKIDNRILEELKKFSGCPFCGNNKIEVTTSMRKYIYKNKVLSGNQYIYKCTNCLEAFTTTLSDTVSFEKFKAKTL